MQLEKRLEISPAVQIASIKDNERFSHYTIYILLGVAGACALYNLSLVAMRYIRTLHSFNNSNNQLYFRSPQASYAQVKQYLLYAPLVRRRHSEPMRIWRFDAGIIPTRFQCLLFLGIIIMNVTLATYGIEWNLDYMTKIMHFRNRLGTLALTNMVPLVFIAGRNNPLIGLTKISYDTFNLVHRWFGHIVIALAFSHAVVEFYLMEGLSKKFHKNPVKHFGTMLQGEDFLKYGFVVSLPFTNPPSHWSVKDVNRCYLMVNDC